MVELLLSGFAVKESIMGTVRWLTCCPAWQPHLRVEGERPDPQSYPVSPGDMAPPQHTHTIYNGKRDLAGETGLRSRAHVAHAVVLSSDPSTHTGQL